MQVHNPGKKWSALDRALNEREFVMRRTIAVMFTDVAGFTSFMEQNEKDAIAMLEEINTSITALLDSHSGSLVKEMGDGTLSYFFKGRSAINCARKIQKSLSERDFQIRIGIHWGSVMLQENDILGDTVNVASRLEKMAPPGGICVSSELLQNLGSSEDDSSAESRALRCNFRLER